MKLVLKAVAATALAAGTVLAAAAPASATASSEARCMGEAVSFGAVTFGPRAVADHQRAAKALFAEMDLTLGEVTRTVASEETC